MDDRKLNILTICSGKGGVGKSFLAANLAYILSSYNAKVLLWDADIFFPNQHIIFGVEPNARMSDMYNNQVELDNVYFQVNPFLTLLADTPAESKNDKVKPSVLHDVYMEILASKKFDYLLIDTPASSLKEIIQCCSFADTITVVINDEPTSLLDAYALIKILVEYFQPEKIKLIVNNVIDGDDANEFSGKLNQATLNFLNISFENLGFVPYDRLVKQSIIKQELFVDKFVSSETTKALHQIAKSIMNKVLTEIEN